MLFPTVEFALFFLMVIILAWGSLYIRSIWFSNLFGWRLAQNGNRFGHALHKSILFFFSYLFYACWDWRFIWFLFGISWWAWVITRIIQNLRGSAANTGMHRRRWVFLGISMFLSILGYYKYSEFILHNIGTVAASLGAQLNISPQTPVLPLGISFITFHAISMVMDAQRGKLDKPVPLLDALLYVSFFPQLIAGPILRAATFLPQLSAPPAITGIETSRALMLIICGLFKKVVIANTLATLLVDDVFSNPLGASASRLLLAIYGYAIQIFCDFSGYTDIAIGCALLLGYHFQINFDAPYTAASPQDFWHRWHISLSTWLRDYLYIPLGGSSGTHWATQLNLMITMVLGGLWHGASWNFVIWGAWQGFLLCLHREWVSFWRLHDSEWRDSVAWRWVARILLFHAICLGWVFFRADNFGVSRDILVGLWNGPWLLDIPVWPLVCVIVGLGLQYVSQRLVLVMQDFYTSLTPLVRGGVFALLLLLCEVLGPSEPAPFIYFQF